MYRHFLLSAMLVFTCNAFCVAQQKVSPVKLTLALAQRIFYNFPTDSIDVQLVVKNDHVLKPASQPVYRLLHIYYQTKTIRIPVKKIALLITDSNVVFADAVKKPTEELTTGYLDLAVNKLNTAHARFPLINGSGILASIKEQQLDTTDIDYTGRYINTNAAAATFTTHASIMATALAGAGNSSPVARGAAPAALVTSTSFASLLPEPDVYYQQANITIQNHSYGTVPENYYGAEAAAYDRSSKANSTLVHVFSAGNSGTDMGTGTYSGLQGWANLTGNFKTAKNVIVVGAIDSFYQVAPASSKGPAFDGRVKPELVAFGEDGSSGAAALVSGTVALLQQAYKTIKNEMPSSALIKAVLLNSADAVNGKQLSYASGYGSLNGYRAVSTLVENRFFEDAVSNAVLKKFSINVPANATQLKVTLAWMDEPGIVNTAKTLVNDLDAVLKNEATGESWLPWVLNAGVHTDSLVKDAARKKDTLNTIEQLSIQAPAAGAYTIEVSGSHIATGTQPFALAYEIDTAAYFEWTFPIKEDPVRAGQTNVLRWQTTHAGKGKMEYTVDGTTWLPINDSIDLAQRYYKWVAPDTFAIARLRMGFSKSSPVLSDSFVMSNATTLQVGFACADSFMLFWNALPVPKYQLYNLDARYLEPVAQTSDTAILFKTDAQHSPYFSVAPIVNGKVGLRSFTINYTGQGSDCYFRSFYVQSQTENTAVFKLLIGTYYNIAGITLQKLETGYFTGLQTISNPHTNDFSFSDTVLTQGVNTYRIQIRLQNGNVVYSEPLRIYHFKNEPVIVYPNPAPQYTPVNLITNKAGRIRIAVYSAAGQLLHEQLLSELLNKATLAGFAKGFYFIRITEDDGTRSTQKMVVY